MLSELKIIDIVTMLCKGRKVRVECRSERDAKMNFNAFRAAMGRIFDGTECPFAFNAARMTVAMKGTGGILEFTVGLEQLRGRKADVVYLDWRKCPPSFDEELGKPLIRV